jgi:hypothetical protein
MNEIKVRKNEHSGQYDIIINFEIMEECLSPDEVIEIVREWLEDQNNE